MAVDRGVPAVPSRMATTTRPRMPALRQIRRVATPARAAWLAADLAAVTGCVLLAVHAWT